jgi:hypothetical protein
VPLLGMGLVLWWITAVHGTTSVQADAMASIGEASLDEAWLLLRRVTYIQAAYLGLFTMPVVAAALPRLPGLLRGLPGRAALAVSAWGAVLGLGLWFFSRDGRLMPYVPHFFSRAGLGPNDLVIARQPIAGRGAFVALTAVCAVASLLLALLVARALTTDVDGGPVGRSGRPAAGLVFALAAWQAVGVLLPSFLFRDWVIDGLPAPSLDRYLLPLLPLVVVLAVWALHAVRPLRASWAVAWILTGVVAAFSFAGTRDNLVFHQQIWALGAEANRLGVGMRQLDAGFSWDGYHLWELSYATGIEPQTPDAPWWVTGFAPATDSSYVVAAGVVDGFGVVLRREYDLWLARDPAELYLLRRPGVPGPP